MIQGAILGVYHNDVYQAMTLHFCFAGHERWAAGHICFYRCHYFEIRACYIQWWLAIKIKIKFLWYLNWYKIFCASCVPLKEM